jgi:hypothetical protein
MTPETRTSLRAWASIDLIGLTGAGIVQKIGEEKLKSL